MENTTRIKTLEDIFSQDRKTIIKRVELFASFFSPSARGDGGGQRRFTPDDIIVYNTIYQMEGMGRSREDIMLTLSSGTLIPDLPARAATANGPSALITYNQMSLLKEDRDRLESEVGRLQQEVKEERREKGRLYERIGLLKGLLRATDQERKYRDVYEDE